jgi:anti-sigma regulatory factor (Ser/Thr protein kinase)
MSADRPPTPEAPAVARRLLRDVLRLWRWGTTDAREVTEFLASEIVTNAVEHVDGEHSLLLEAVQSDCWVRVSVADNSSLRPIVRELEHLQPGGLGMRFVEALADRWGVEDHHGGKKVWFEMSPGSPR